MATKIADKTLITDEEGTVIGQRFEFTNGNVFEALLEDLPAEMVERCAILGLGAKLGDSYAGAATKGQTVDECEAGVRAIWAALKAGSFGAGRTATGGKLFEAFARWAVDEGKTRDEAREAFDALSEDQKKDLRKATPIKAKIAEIDAENAARAAAAAEESDEDLTAKYF